MSPKTSHYLEPRNVNLLRNKVFADVIKDQDEATLGTSWRSQLVKAPSFHCRRGTGSIPGQGTKIPHAVQGPSTSESGLKKEKRPRDTGPRNDGGRVEGRQSQA